MTRRKLLRAFVSAAAIAVAGQLTPAAETPAKPLWYGFNLLEKFSAPGSAFKEDDFKMVGDWGFNFLRLPMSYRCWGSPDDLTKMDEAKLAEIDQAVEFGRKYKVHTCLNLHRAPGYCVNPPKEPLDLWKDAKAQEGFAYQWAALAKRYKGVPSEQVSFNLINEPNAQVTEDLYAPVMRLAAKAIRAEDPQRQIIVDGLKWGHDPAMSLVDDKIGQSTRGYQPMRISHHKAGWIAGSDKWPDPTWPLKTAKGEEQGAEWLRKQFDVWKPYLEKGGFLHAGEWGAHNKTPHAVALAWMKDQLAIWKEMRLGWALWNLRGSFGVMDSGRSDVQYESVGGRKLDRKMLDVLIAGRM